MDMTKRRNTMSPDKEVNVSGAAHEPGSEHGAGRKAWGRDAAPVEPSQAEGDGASRPAESDTTDNRAVDELQDDVEAGEGTLASKIEQLREALRAAEAEILRGQAELENFRKRARRDMEEERRYACLPLMRDLLPVIDNLQRALAHGTQGNPETVPLLAGVQMVAQELTQTLEKHHCRQIEAAGEAFDPNYHEAIGQFPSAAHAAGHVAQVVTEGYRLHDRVIRPSQVLVSTGAPEGTSKTDSSEG
jgi:molecular chaperone GrpE